MTDLGLDLLEHFTLLDIRKKYRNSLLRDGAHCPVCDRWGKVYKRRLNKTMVKCLEWVVNVTTAEDVKYIDIPARGRLGEGDIYDFTKQYSTLKHWGFLQRPDGEEPRSGIWGPTPSGIRFLRGLEQAPEWIATYNDIAVEWAEDLVSVSDIVEGFSYDQIMTDALGFRQGCLDL